MKIRGYIFCAALTTLSAFPAGGVEVSGRVWEDVNGNGLREAGEPAFTNAAVFLQRSSPWLSFTNMTGSGGAYSFTNVPDGNYLLSVLVDAKYDITVPNAGTNESVDSDLVYYSTFTLTGATDPFDVAGSSISNLDAGYHPFTPAVELRVRANGRQTDAPLYVTNGTWVSFVYELTNAGDIALSGAFTHDAQDGGFVLTHDCPDVLDDGGGTAVATNLRMITASETNAYLSVGFPVNAYCGFISSLDPAQHTTQSVILVVTNDPLGFADHDALPNWWEIQYRLDPLNSNPPSRNSDGDWMTDLEEFWADTNPTNAESYLPNAVITRDAVSIPMTSTARMYRTWRSTGLAAAPQQWELVDEMTGTGSEVSFPIGEDEPLGLFKTGVVTP